MEENANHAAESQRQNEPSGEKNYTQAELDAIVASRLEQERKTMPGTEELNAFRSWKEQQQTEAERMQAITRERDEANEALKAANAKAEQYDRERILLTMGISAEDVDYYAFKIGKMVTDTRNFAAAAKDFFKDKSTPRVRFDTTGGMNGRPAAKTAGQTMNDLIRGIK